MNTIAYIAQLFFGIPDWSAKIEPCKADNLHQLLTWSLSTGIICVAIILIFVYAVHKSRVLFNRFTDRWLPVCFTIVWLMGVVVYDVGTYTGEWPSLFLNMPMAMLHALGMFLLESDVSAIHAPFHDSWEFMGLFSITHFLAAIVSFAFVIRHFGFNIAAWCKMFFKTRCKKNGNLYLFWGMNDASYYLATSIKEFYKGRKDYRIAIVRTNSKADYTEEKNGVSRLFHFLSLRNRDLNRLQELKCFTTTSFSGEVKLSAGLVRLIKNTCGDVHLFFLSEQPEDNIRAVEILRENPILDSIMGKPTKAVQSLYKEGKRSVQFYCRARYNSVHRVIENDFLKENLKVNVVDTSHISVEMMKQKDELHPVNFVKVEKDASVSTLFHSLVVGFGEVGYDAVRFLYEFGAFVKTGSTDNHVEQSDFHCDVVDKNMSEQAGVFVANAPSVSLSQSLNDKKIDNNALITLHQMDSKSIRFYQHLKEWIKTLNYVVIAQDDDEANISLAIRIFQFAVRYRNNMEKFRILVRVRHDEDGHILRIAEHYNRLWAAEMKSKNKIHQACISSQSQIEEPITIFGSEKSLFTYSYIISNQLQNQAMEFKKRYDKSVCMMQENSEVDVDTPGDWETEYLKLMQLTPEYKGFSPTLSGITRLRRIQRQNIANSLHAKTKRMLAREALGDELYGVFNRHELYRYDQQVIYHWKPNMAEKPAVIRVLNVLAQTEHLRWNASHEILGYWQYGENTFKDEARMQHACLVPWEKLSEQVQSYDYNVVDVTLGIV